MTCISEPICFSFPFRSVILDLFFVKLMKYCNCDLAKEVSEIDQFYLD